MAFEQAMGFRPYFYRFPNKAPDLVSAFANAVIAASSFLPCQNFVAYLGQMMSQMAISLTSQPYETFDPSCGIFASLSDRLV